MGLRYRKSISLGGGFRINLSKSGVGYSWGTKGFRLTNTAKGTTRITASIPGTGISWVEEISNKSNKQSNNSGSSQNIYIDSNHYDTRNIENQVNQDTISEGLEEMLQTAQKSIQLNTWSTLGILLCVFLPFLNPFLIFLIIIPISLKIIVKNKGVIDLDYSIDEDQENLVEKRMQPFKNMMCSSKVWRITQTSKVIDNKYTSGASNTVKRTLCTTSDKPMFPFKSNIEIVSLIGCGENLLFLPDKIFIIKGSNIGILNYSDISLKNSSTRFVENESTPNDATVVGSTWKYVNKNGGPDKRFKDNRELPICLYGEINLESSKGLDTVIMHSRSDN